MTIKQLGEIIEQGESLKLISQAYTEIASAKLRRIRGMVEKNRYFLEDLSKVFQVVKTVANQKKILPIKNNKTVTILITSNYHFYGSVNSNLIKFFLANINKVPSDQIIIGKTALAHLQSVKYLQKYEAFILKDDLPNTYELNNLVAKIKDYSQILVYYSQLKSVIVQIPNIQDISQTSHLTTPTPEDKKMQNTFIFEPEIEKILTFFESQATNLLLQGTFLESELSRTASRLVSMDEAQTNADKYISDQKKMLSTAKKTINNTKLLEIVSVLRTLKGETVG